MKRTVFLIGARASGKTTLGRELARILDWSFVDTDQYLLETTQQTVASLVAAEGWEGFRRRESTALRSVTKSETVVATGGGMVLMEANRTFMREQGTVLYLYVPASVLCTRLASAPEDAQRPSLTGASLIDEVEEILALRDPVYREVAHDILDASTPLQILVEQSMCFLGAGGTV